jgi:hypothetical protein
VADLDHVDAVIRLFDPAADVGRPKRYPIAHLVRRRLKRGLIRYWLGELAT